MYFIIAFHNNGAKGNNMYTLSCGKHDTLVLPRIGNQIKSTQMPSQAIASYFLTRFSIFNPTQYMSMSHEYSTMVGIECGDRDQ